MMILVYLIKLCVLVLSDLNCPNASINEARFSALRHYAVA